MPSSDPSPDSSPQYANVAPESMVHIGFVFRPHGIDGELKINPEKAGDPTRFEELETVYLGRGPSHVTEHSVASVRYQETKRGTTVILGLADIETRTAAEEVMKLHVFAAEDDLELGEGEILVEDLVGLEVVTESDESVGTVANYMEMPAQDVFVVRRPNDEEVMVPAVEDFIVDLDLDGGELVIRPIEGLIDEAE